jgi:hypothetical protein
MMTIETGNIFSIVNATVKPVMAEDTETVLEK